MTTSGDTIESRRAEIARWLARGLDIHVASPTAGNPLYKATLPDSGLIGEGPNEDAALEALIAHLTDVMTAHMLHGIPLPDRPVNSGNE